MQFQKGESGNPLGRLRGARNRRTVLIESILEEDLTALARKLVELAKSGDVAALRLCVDRLCPAQRERPAAIELPPMTTAADAVAGMAAIVQAIGEGELDPGEAGKLADVVAAFSQTVATAQLEERLDYLEKALALLKQAGHEQ